MSILIVVAGVLGALVLFSLIKKLIKWMLIFATMLVLTLIGGYLFLSGDGSMTQEYLLEEVQQEVNTLRDNTNQTIKTKADETKQRAMEKAGQVTEEATNKMKEGIQQAVDESKKSIEKSVQEALNGTKNEPETIEKTANKEADLAAEE
jgi:gas vesicle protein